jgi:hypothetical protein
MSHAVSLQAATLLLVLAAAAPAAAQQADSARAYYPAAPGDSWTYDSSLRGEFTNRVADTVRLDGQLWHRVVSTTADGTPSTYLLRHDGARVYQRAGSAPEMLLADFSLAVGGYSQATQAGGDVRITYVAHHDTVTLLGARWHDVRQYRTATRAMEYDTYYARGIGIVGTRGRTQPIHSRLLRATVAGVDHVAAEAPAPTSGVRYVALTAGAVERLALLARVWGFAKYHHPAITGGGVDWDRELFRVMPAVIDAPDMRAASGVIDGWLAELGDPPACSPCAELRRDLHLPPDNDWIHDAETLGPELSHRLTAIQRNRSTTAAQRYVSLAPGVGNPLFTGEDAYESVAEPDAGFRMLALFRYWNIIRYWFPYRDLLDDDWDDVIAEFIPIFTAAADADAYRLAVLRLIARTQDTHATLPRANALRPPVGAGQLPVLLRFIEGHPVVTGYSSDELGRATGLQPGDALVTLDGAPVDALVREWAPYYAASNEPARLHAMARSLTRGPVGPAAITIRRGDALLEKVVERAPLGGLDLRRGTTHDLPGPAFRMLDDDVAYLKLSAVALDSLPGWMERAASARVLVVDIRNYPAQFVVFALGGRLVEGATPFAVFTTGDTSNPGAFAFTQPVSLVPVMPRFSGRVVVLVDESSISQSEYTAMALRAGPNSIIAGSTTAGADGNVSAVPLPGGLETRITGIGVFHPDRSPTQRIGIIPDVEVRPTIAGIRDGRDEVLEAGVSAALGRPWRMVGGAHRD